MRGKLNIFLLLCCVKQKRKEDDFSLVEVEKSKGKGTEAGKAVVGTKEGRKEGRKEASKTLKKRAIEPIVGCVCVCVCVILSRRMLPRESARLDECADRSFSSLFFCSKRHGRMATGI